MTPERWEQVSKLYQTALEVAPDRRSAFLNEACGDNEDLRREVESLLAAQGSAGGFLSAGAMNDAAKMLMDERSISLTGRTLGRYRVLSLLGAGGMGEVYLAEDTELHRKVALKRLPAELTTNQNRLRRFEQEARAISALNHPNIITIYEISQAEGLRFIVSEFIEGRTLRERMASERLKLDTVLDFAVQIAGALAAAHAAGIVHRDIKPENIMIRGDGLLKVLDFGLAKLAEAPTAALGSELPTATRLKTEPGLVLGTPSYMSPEQARGDVTDHRSDLWALGVILYEMICGHPPFRGETASHIIVSILEREAQPLFQIAPDTPIELQRIVRKALTKDRDERYQTARDLLIDLKALRRELDLQGEIKRSAPSGVGFPNPASTSQVASQISTAPSSGSTALATKSLSSWLVIGGVAAVALLAGVVVAAVFGIRWLRSKSSAEAFQRTEITQLTTSRNLTQVAISPDGKYIAYAATDGENESLWLRQANAANDLQIVSPKPLTHVGITFTHDSISLYYVIRERNGASALYRIPALGGTPQKLISGVDTPVTFSPDGTRLAFVRGKYPTVDESALLIADSDGSQERILAKQHAPRFFYPVTNWTGPSWSPNGELIACAVTEVSIRRTGNVYTFAVKDGAAKKIMPQDFSEVGRVEWLADMSGLVIVGTDKFIGQFPGQIFHVSYSDGAARRITNDFGNYRGLSITSDASKLVTISFNDLYGIWVAPDGDAARARQVLPVSMRAAVSWTPDGRIVFATNMAGRSDVWIMNADGSARKQLTNNAEQNIDPSVSPDGRYVAFYSTRTGRADAWRIDIDGSNPRELTSGSLNWQQSWTPDSKWVLFITYPDWKVWKVPVDGGTPVPVTDRPSFRPVVSPDGKWLACFYSNSSAEVSSVTVYDLAILSLDGNSPPKILPFHGGRLDPTYSFLQWSVDGRAILYNSSVNNVGNIWSQPIDGGPAKQVSDFKDSEISAFAWSRDGRWLACTRGTEASDAVMISQVK